MSKVVKFSVVFLFVLGVLFGINLYLCSGLQFFFKAWHVEYFEQKKGVSFYYGKSYSMRSLKDRH